MQILEKYVADCSAKMQLTVEVVWIDAKLTASIRLAKASREYSVPVASLMSHMSMSFCSSPD